ncbi:MAG: outer membrane lipoprotein-sorting protein [Rhodospirillales bacterium]|nr:outer membrane lipoprotein-sorting protein [Rhodospirillales bacterium]
MERKSVTLYLYAQCIQARWFLAAAVMVLLTACTLAVTAKAETPEEKGLAIALEADRRDTGFTDTTADLLMILRNKQGDESRREIRYRALEVDGDGDKALMIFNTPRDIKDTKLLTFSHKTGPDDQWLFLPALKRVKRISSSNKSGPFVGSEFAYEDMASQEVEKYTYRHLRDEPCGALTCFVVERKPTDQKSGYNRQVIWLDQAHYRSQKVDYYDRRDSLLKTLVFSGYRQYLEKHWRADEMDMQNHQTGKGTKLIWSNYNFKTGLTEDVFRKKTLPQAR